MMPEKPLAGRVAVVTGVSRRIGIGFAVAERMAGMGADLLVQSHTAYDADQPWGADPGGVEPLLAALRAHGGRVEHIAADFLDPAAPARVIAAGVAAYGHIDILVANHAYSVNGNLEEVTAEQIDRHLTINVRGSLLLVQAFAAQHDGRPGGRVVLLTSGQHLGPMADELAYIAFQGRAASAYLEPLGPPNPARHHREHRQPRPHRHRLGHSRAVGRDPPGCAAGPLGPAGRRSPAHRLAGDGRRRLDHRASHQLDRRI